MNCDFLETEYYYATQHSSQGESECLDILNWLRYVACGDERSHSTADESHLSTQPEDHVNVTQTAPNLIPKRGNLITYLIIYVDDMIVTGDDKEEITKLKKYLFTEFKMKDLGRLKYFLGIDVLRSKQRDLHVPKKFQSHLNMEVILKMIKDETYESKFNNFLREKSGKEKDDDLSVQKNCDNFRRLLFKKELTLSDVGKLSRLVVPKKFDVVYFPPVPDNDHSEGFVNDEVIFPFYDVDNKLWKFWYCYWKSSQSSVFTHGWNQFVKEKN
uniref:AP2/ERF and B3 domain-containing transcription factor At1g50680-like n=1 Tax=Tanacetum cinerariifolium TaxID=118510 RepID=A0A699HZ68_TANCI|nr:AP2/ERF and B3 domain-containing transcription factor At1g50680-like [Tanacetum cinerariifolium]